MRSPHVRHDAVSIVRRRFHTFNTRSPLGYAWPMADAADQPLDQQLEEIGAQLAWVRDYL